MKSVVVVIVEQDGCRLGVSLDEAAALTLVAAAISLAGVYLSVSDR